MLEIAVTVILTGSLGVLIHVVKTDTLRGGRDYWKALAEAYEHSNLMLQGNWLTARQAHTDLADKHNATLERLQRIQSIPNNGKKPNGGLLKAQRIAGGEI